MSDTTCTVIKGTKVYQSNLNGLRPLMNWLNNDPDVLKDSYVIDKVIGKASALLLTYGKAAKVHGITMSKAAVKVLEENHIEYSYDTLVDFIENQTKTGMCPMEMKVADIEEPEKAYQTFRDFFASMQKQN